MDKSSDTLPLGSQVTHEASEREAIPETLQKEDQVMNELPNMKASSGSHQIVSKAVYEISKTEASSENFQKEDQAMHEPSGMETSLETAHEVQVMHKTSKLEPSSESIHREGQVLDEPPKAETLLKTAHEIQVMHKTSKLEPSSESIHREGQIMHELPKAETSLETAHEVQVMHKTSKLEPSSESFHREDQIMHEPPKAETSLETAREVQVTYKTSKLEPLSESLHREGQAMHKPPMAETSSESFNQEVQVHYKMQSDVTQATKRQKLECPLLHPVEIKSTVSEKISPDANLCSSRFVVSPGEKAAINFQYLETEKNCVIENGEKVAQQVNEIQENIETSFPQNQLSCKEHSNNKNIEITPDKDCCNKIQEKEKQEQQPKKQKGGHVGENYERINYLVQASRALVNMGGYNSESGSVDFDQTLASQTGSMASAVGRRCLIRLTPSLKRMLCKGCGTVLIYGVNSKVRHRSKRQKHLVITCLTCNTIKRFVVNPDHKLWCDQEEALV